MELNFQAAKAKSQKVPAATSRANSNHLMSNVKPADPNSQPGQQSQKGVPKISSLASNADRTRKFKSEPGMMEAEDQFPDDDAFIMGVDVFPEVKQEVTSQPPQDPPLKNLLRKIEPISQVRASF